MIKIINAVLACVFLALIGVLVYQLNKPEPQMVDRSEFHYDRGVEYGARGSFVKAKVEFELALENDPFYTPAEGSLTILDGVMAQKIAEQSARHLFRGIQYGNQFKPVEKIREIDQALEITPDIAIAYNERGTAYFHLEKYQQAIEDREKAIALNPSYPDPYYNIAIACEYAGHLEKAHQAYQNYILMADPKHKFHIDYARSRMTYIVQQLKQENMQI